MKVICQKVKYAICKTNEGIYSIIGYGLVVFLGISKMDTKNSVDFLTKKILNIKIYDTSTKTLVEQNQDILLIFDRNMSDKLTEGPSECNDEIDKSKARDLFELFYKKLTDLYPIGVVKKGFFDEPFSVNVRNQGPFTIFLNK